MRLIRYGWRFLDTGAVRICASLPISVFWSTHILRFLVTAAIRKPKLVIAIALLMLAALAGAMTYTGFLVVGVLADYLGTGRVLAGLMLGALFARFPWISKGGLRIVGLLPKIVRRPLIVRRAIFDRILSAVVKFNVHNRPKSRDDMVIDGEFRELRSVVFLQSEKTLPSQN